MLARESHSWWGETISEFGYKHSFVSKATKPKSVSHSYYINNHSIKLSLLTATNHDGTFRLMLAACE
jgi:hypothetical protein